MKKNKKKLESLVTMRHLGERNAFLCCQLNRSELCVCICWQVDSEGGNGSMEYQRTQISLETIGCRLAWEELLGFCARV